MGAIGLKQEDELLPSTKSHEWSEEGSCYPSESRNTPEGRFHSLSKLAGTNIIPQWGPTTSWIKKLPYMGVHNGRNWTRTNDLFLVRSKREVSIVSTSYIRGVLCPYYPQIWVAFCPPCPWFPCHSTGVAPGCTRHEEGKTNLKINNNNVYRTRRCKVLFLHGVMVSIVSIQLTT
jgi:hypothetical protein